MIDSIRLKFEYPLPTDSFYFQKPLGRSSIYTNNHWRDQKQRSGFYVPKYWIERGFIQYSKTFLCLEASLPKLLWGENLREIKESDFKDVIDAIGSFLIAIGIEITRDAIINAIPMVVAIGRNIDVSDLCSSATAMTILKPFDFKSRSDHNFIEYSGCSGQQLTLNNKSESLKVYEKMKEIVNNNNQTKEEQIIAKNWRDGIIVNEILRFELTLKNRRKVAAKLNPYLDGAEPSLKNIFSQKLWNLALGKEIERVFNPPLKNLVLLSGGSQNFIDDYLNSHCYQLATRELTRAIIIDIKDLGLCGARQKYQGRYKSNKSWYNVQRRLVDFDYSALTNLTNKHIHGEVLRRLGNTN